MAADVIGFCTSHPIIQNPAGGAAYEPTAMQSCLLVRFLGSPLLGNFTLA